MRTIDEIIQEKKQQELENKTSQIQSNFYVSYPVSPEQASKQYDIAKSTNIPIGVVRAKENEILKRTELSTFNNEDWVNNFPAVANQLADIALAPAIKDDLDSLTNFEVLARSTKEKFQQSALQDQTVDTRLKRMRFEATKNESFKLSPIEESDIATFDASQPKDYNLNWFESVVPETTGAVRTRYGVIRNALPKAVVGAGIGAATGFLTGNAPGAAIGATILGRITAYAATGYEMAKLETAGAYDELRTVVDENGKPLEKNVAAGAAIATGVINGAIELIPVKVGLDSVKKAFSRAGIKQAAKNPIIREYLGNIAKGVLVEGGTEGAQELFNIIAAESAKVFSDGDFKRLGMKDASDIEGLFKFVSDSASRIGQSAAAGSAAGGGVAVVGGGAIATKRIYDQRKVNEKEQEIIGSILDTAKQSKVLNRSSELFKDVTANTLGETNIYLPVDDFKTYFQDKPDKLASFYANAAIQDQIQEAVDTGGNIIIKANELSAAIKADPELESLREFMKLTPESFTSLEAQDEFLQTVVPSYFQEENTRQERSDQNVVKQNIRQQLSNLGMPNEVVKQNIDLLTSFYDTQVKRYGAKDAQKIVDSYIGNLEANVQRFQKPPVNLNKIEDLDLMLDKARKPIKQLKAGKPLLKTLKEMGGVKLGSDLAVELNHLGITPKTYVGLFKKDGGIGDIDNIPVSEFQEKFPNASPEIEGNYISRQYLLDRLADEARGQDISQVPNEEQRNIQNFLEGLDRAGIDINGSNEEIKKAIREFESQTFNQTQEIKLEQQGRYGSFYGEFNGGNIRVSDHPAGKKAQEIEGGGYEGGKRSIGLENYQELKENGVKFYASDDFRDVIIPVKGKISDKELLQNLIVRELRRTAYIKNAQAIDKEVSVDLPLDEYRQKITSLQDEFVKTLSEQDKAEAEKRAKSNLKDEKKTLVEKQKQELLLDNFKKIEPFVKNKILELEGQTYFQAKDQTKTPAFKKWFGDSKVVDEKGEPLVVYHGSNAKFDAFDTKKIGQTATAEGYGFYLTDNKEIAKGYQRDGGSLIEAYLSMQKPLDSKRKPFNAKEISQVLNKMVDVEVKKFSGEIADYKDSFLSNFVDTYSLSKAQAIKEVAQLIVEGNETAIDQISELSNVVGDKTTVPEAVRDALGFDGVEVKDFQQGEGTVYLAWFPTQIKSAIGNQGTFDPENLNIYYQSAFHGTPHRFDKFTLDHIGSGEGAQAYGWGLYFAGDKEVAEYYRKGLSQPQYFKKSLFGKKEFNPETQLRSSFAKRYFKLEMTAKEVDEALSSVIEKIKDRLNSSIFKKERNAEKSDLKVLQKVRKEYLGQLYKVNIPEAETFLDWDKSIDKQNNEVKKLIEENKTIYEISNGKDFYKILSEQLGSPRKASEYLHSKGVNGIKYLDGNSRAKKEGSHNYVVFDDAAIDVVKTYYQTAPTFYSALEKQITDLPQGKGSPEQWAGIIKNLTQKGVKQEELDWTGVEDWIKEQKGSVTKEQILDYLKANKIEVEEVVKGDYPKQLQDLYKQLEEKNNGKQFDDWKVEDQDAWMKKRGKPAETKFSKFTLAGGENYRELLLTLPESEKLDEKGAFIKKELNKYGITNPSEESIASLLENGVPQNIADDFYEHFVRGNIGVEGYQSSHYDEPNILAHIRFNKRTDAEGNKVMFVEELQSDWHQEGRKKGYKDVELLKKVKEEIKAIGVYKPFGQVSYTDLLEAKAPESLLKKYEEAYDSYMGVPNAPFKTTWNELAFKRALLWAVENNFDKVAWTTGEQQAERYDLSKQIDSIAYAKASDGKTVSLDVEKNGSNVFSRANISINELPDIVGKEVADKIVKGEYTDTNDLGYNVLSGLDLKVGGEGMKAFYDKIVPAMVNKLAKKFGGKVETSNIKEVGDVWSLEITPAMRESIQKQGLPLFQNEAKPQGQTQFLPNKPIITLFETADRSTLLHELGHVFLQIQADLSKLPNMPKQFQEDWAIIEKFLDIKDGKITREAHEKFARSFEAYLREGKAPTVELREAFRKFKAWLITIYKDVLQLNAKINDDIRGVFDRMLATDEQIELNRDTPLFKVDTNILELLTKAERKDYLKRTEEAKEKTKEILLRKALKQKEKENSKAYKEDRAKVEAEVRDEMNKDKTFRALHFLKTGKLLGEDTELNPVKLSSKEVKNYDGEFIKYLPKEIFGKNSASVEMIAEEFGFKNGSEMLFALANAKDFKEELETATDAEMMRRYGNMLFDGSLEREALEASDSEAVANKIVYELDAVNRKVKSVRESKDAYKAKAKEMFATKKIPDATDVNKYYINGLKAAREAGKALGKKDYEKAVEWKKKQLLNHYLFQESSRFKKELVRANRSYKLIKRKPSKNKVLLDEEFREKALSLLQNFGLAEKPFDYKELDVNELEAWKAQKKSEEGILGLVEFPEIAEFKTKDFNQLTTEEFRTLNDSIQNLAFVGRDLRVIEIEGKKYELNALAGEIADTVREGKKQRPEILGSKTAGEKIVEGFDEYTSILTKAKLKAELLDGKQFGKIYNTIIDPVAQGELVRNARTKEVFENYKAIYGKHFGKKGIERKRIYQSSGYQFSKESIIALTLNWGTPINRRRVRDGFKISDSEVSNLMSKLDKNELEFIQELWDFLDSFWGETSALNKKLYGFSPSKQKPEGFVVRSADGQKVEMQGGYYPIAYAENYSDLSKLETIGYSKALSFDKSFLKERTTQKVEKKLELTLIPAIQHISDVVSDLSIKEASFNSFKILNHRNVKKAIIDVEGNATFNIFDSWIKDLFGNGRTAAGILGKILDHARIGMIISTMGLKFATTVMQISGYPQSIVKIGFVPMAKGLLKFLGNGNPMDINKSYKFALEKSKILKTRESGYNRDVYDTLKIMEGKGVISRNLVNMSFYQMSKVQMLVDLPTWYGAYYKGLKDFKGDDNMAVKYADKIVVQAQGSGLLQDLSAFERGTVGGLTKSNLIKLFTTFMTYFNAKYNLALESYKNTDFKKPSNVAKFTSDIILLYAVEALIGQFVLGKIPDFDDEDEDSAIAYTFKLMADNYFAQFPIAREVSSIVKDFDGAPTGFGGVIMASKGLKSAVNESLEDEPDITKIIEGINQSGGILFHYPAGQIDVYLDASQRAQEGEEVPVIDYLRKPKK